MTLKHTDEAERTMVTEEPVKPLRLPPMWMEGLAYILSGRDTWKEKKI
jgi:hypothetical protein